MRYVGSAITLSDVVAGGSWNVDVNASVDGSGDVTGISAGVAVITYGY